jgi:hypothetical protein
VAGVVADDEYDRSDIAGEGGVEGRAQEAAPVDDGVELVLGPVVAAAPSGSQDDRDNVRAHRSKSRPSADKATTVTPNPTVR